MAKFIRFLLPLLLFCVLLLLYLGWKEEGGGQKGVTSSERQAGGGQNGDASGHPGLSPSWDLTNAAVASLAPLSFYSTEGAEPEKDQKQGPKQEQDQDQEREQEPKQELKQEQKQEKEPPCHLPTLDPWHPAILPWVTNIPEVECSSSQKTVLYIRYQGGDSVPLSPQEELSNPELHGPAGAWVDQGPGGR